MGTTKRNPIRVEQAEDGALVLLASSVRTSVDMSSRARVEIPCTEADMRELLVDLAEALGVELPEDEEVDPHEHCDDHPCQECTEGAYARAEAMCGGDR